MKLDNWVSILFVSVLLLSSCFGSVLAKEKSEIVQEESSLRLEIKQLSESDQLEGRIEKAASKNVSELKEFLSSLHQLKRSTYDIFCEVQREDLVVVGEPNVIGPMIVPAIPSGSGLLNTGLYLPARKKWIDYYMAQIEKLYPMITKELENFKLDKSVSKKSKKHYVNIVKAYNKLGPALKELDKITLGPKYDNKLIAKSSAIAQNYIQIMDKESKRLYKELKKSEHKAKRDLHEIERKLKKDKRELDKDERKLDDPSK